MKKLIFLLIIMLPLISLGQTYKNWSQNVYQKGYWKFDKAYPLIGTDTISTRAYARSVSGTGGGGDMVYPGAGIPLSTGSAWGTSITNNSSNWNTAYGWGNHASEGYLTEESDPISSAILQDTVMIDDICPMLADSTESYVTPTSMLSFYNQTYSVSDPLIALQEIGSTIKAYPLFGLQAMTATTVTPTDARIYLNYIYIDKPTTITGVKTIVSQAGVFTPDNFNGVALYSISSGTYTRVAVSDTISTMYFATGIATVPFTGEYEADPGGYYVAYMYSNSAQTTTPILYGCYGIQLTFGSLIADERLAGHIDSQTSMPASIARASVSGNNVMPIIWLY